MSITAVVTTALGITYKSKRECALEPFKRTLELATLEHDKAVEALKNATDELVRVVEEQKGESDECN